MRFTHRKPNTRAEFFLVKPRGRNITRAERRVWKLSSHSVELDDYKTLYNNCSFHFMELSDQKQSRKERIVLRRAGRSTLPELNTFRFRPRPGEYLWTRRERIVCKRRWVGVMHVATAKAKIEAVKFRELFE